MTSIEKGYLMQPGEWSLLTGKRPRQTSRDIAVGITCPQCGKRLVVDDESLNIDSGRSYEPVKCDTVGCSFHDEVTLDQWKSPFQSGQRSARAGTTYSSIPRS